MGREGVTHSSLTQKFPRSAWDEKGTELKSQATTSWHPRRHKAELGRGSASESSTDAGSPGITGHAFVSGGAVKREMLPWAPADGPQPRFLLICVIQTKGAFTFSLNICTPQPPLLGPEARKHHRFSAQPSHFLSQMKPLISEQLTGGGAEALNLRL